LASTLLELTWLRSAAAALPGSVPAAALVVPVFMVAWSAGSMVAGRLADRRGARTEDHLGLAARWLAGSAVAALGVPWLMEALLLSDSPNSVAMRVLIGGLPVAPAAFGLGGALPLFARLRRAEGLSPARATGGVAASVALGGALGAWWWVPVFETHGDSGSLAAMALALGALLSWTLQVAQRVAPVEPMCAAVETEAEEKRASGGVDLGFAAFLGGALLVGGQLAILRVTAQSQGDSVATTSRVLVGIHVGMAVGALWMACPFARFAARGLVALLLGLAGMALLLPAFWPLEAVTWRGWLFPLVLTVPLGVGAGSLVTAASRSRTREAGRLGSWVGDLAAWSTLGGVAGGYGYGMWLAPSPAWGTGPALQLMTALALAAGVFLALRALGGARSRTSSVFVLLLLAAGATLAWRTPPMEMPWRADLADAQLVEQIEGPYGVVSLVATEDGALRLKLDNRFGLGGSEGAALEQRMGRLAACFHPEAERALVLGLGRGQTLAGFASTTAARVDCVERNAQILELGLEIPYAHEAMPIAGPPTVVHADARAWLADHPSSYDLIVGDLFFPWVTGAGDLLVLEQFLELRRALRPGGVVVQWLPLHQIPWPAFGAVATAFLEVFPTGRLFVATPLANRPLVALVGGMVRGLPRDELVNELLATSPSLVGPNSSVDVYDLYVTDAWGLGTQFIDEEPATRLRPVSEAETLGRHEDEAWIGATNTRLLSELTSPLDTSSLVRPPIDSREDKLMGVELRARSNALKGLLLARSAMLQSAWPETDEDERAELEMLSSAALLQAWRAAGGHTDVRRALVEWSRRLAAEGRALEGAHLLSAALEVMNDAALAGVLGKLFLQMEMIEEAADLLGQVYAVQPADRVVLLDYATALLLAGQDEIAARMLRRLLDQTDGKGLPDLQAVGLGLLEKDADAGPAADALLEQQRTDSPWSQALKRLRARVP
jgi:spermidine synthase